MGAAYSRLAGAEGRTLVRQQYRRSWEGDLLAALGTSRRDDLRRGVNTVGPHRDDLALAIEDREARTHASQGEQRCLALALRLGVHELVRARTALVPTLLLDDVFSELDPDRSRALVAELPEGQAILTTAAPAARGHHGGAGRPGAGTGGRMTAGRRRGRGASGSRCHVC